MDERLGVKLEALRAAIKERWERLLRAEPAISPLGNPDTLVFLMDRTLDHWIAGMTAGAELRWLNAEADSWLSLHRRCACGLNPLLGYFSAGELALREAAGPSLGDRLHEGLALFHALAHEEIEAVCRICRLKPAGGCAGKPGR